MISEGSQISQPPWWTPVRLRRLVAARHQRLQLSRQGQRLPGAGVASDQGLEEGVLEEPGGWWLVAESWSDLETPPVSLMDVAYDLLKVSWC